MTNEPVRSKPRYKTLIDAIRSPDNLHDNFNRWVYIKRLKEFWGFTDKEIDRQKLKYIEFALPEWGE